MNIASRISMLGGKPSAKSYVQDGLIVHLNCKENAGYGQYNPTATVWRDLSGNNRHMTLTGSFEWSRNLGLIIKSFSERGLGTFNSSHNAIHTVEIVYRCFSSYGLFGRILCENQWLCSRGIGWKIPYYVYGWSVDGEILLNKCQNTAVAQTIAVRDDGTKRPELFNNGVSQGVFTAKTDNVGRGPGYIANRLNYDRGVNAAYMAIRIYNRCLSDDELEHNAKIDKKILGTKGNNDIFEIEGGQFVITLGNGQQFEGCTNLVGDVNLPLCTHLGLYTFKNCTGITSISLPSCIYVYYNPFEGCTSLRSLNLQSLEHTGLIDTGIPIDFKIFQNLPSLQSINLRSITYISGTHSIGYNDVKLSNMELGTLTGTETDTIIGTNAGQDAPPDQQGIRLTVKVGNTMSSLRALTYFPFDMPTWGKWQCSDGCIVYENGDWVDKPTV